MKKEIEKCLEKIKEDAILTASNFENKKFQSNGFDFQLTEGRANYNFKAIPEWIEVDKKKKEIESRAKTAYQAYKKKLNVADENGEVSILPTVTYSKESLSVKRQKNE